MLVCHLLASLIVQLVKNLPAMQETLFWSLGGEDPLEDGMATHSSILAWRILWTEGPGGYSPWGHKESDRTEPLTLQQHLVSRIHWPVVWWAEALGLVNSGFLAYLLLDIVFGIWFFLYYCKQCLFENLIFFFLVQSLVQSLKPQRVGIHSSFFCGRK